MRGCGLWQLGHSVTRRLALTKKRVLHHRCFSSETELKKTVLYDFHVANGGKMVPFAGCSMPIQYKDSIMESTVNCRENGGLFDFSYMSGLSLMGKDCIPFIEKLVVADIAGLAPGTGTFSVFTNDRGGTIDDTVITKVKDNHIYLVVNAGNCRFSSLEHIEEHMNAFKSKGGDVSWKIHHERSLLSLQGPLAATVLQRLTKEDLSKIYFGQFKIVDVNGAQCFLTRTGCTGEDGFEISIPSDNVLDLAQGILESSRGKVRLSGLGAKDSLKLEAGLCLYGNGNMDTTPVEAGLTWAIGKRRRIEGDFLGADAILKQIEEGPLVRRVGFVSSGPPPRKNSQIQNAIGENIGEVTSGGFSPCLKKNIGIGYVKSGNHKYGTNVKIVIRAKSYNGTVTRIPFVPTKHYNQS